MSKAEQLAEELKRKFKESESVQVKIALIGQPGAGKSSLINALLGEKVFEVGVRTDTTIGKQEKEFGSITIVDLPGYGTKAFPFNGWLKMFQPEQYDLYLFVFEGKLHDSDAQLFESLRQWKKERKHPYFIVRNKSDQIWDDTKSIEELKNLIKEDVYSKMGDRSANVYFTSCREQSGIAELKEDIFKSDIPTVKKSKLIAGFRADTLQDLENKKNICLEKVDIYAYMCAANGLNPIPGVDISVDIALVSKLMSDIRCVFGLDNEDQLKKYEIALPLAKELIEKVLEYTTAAGVSNVLKKAAINFIGKNPLKVVPFIGQALSAIAGYMMVESLGKEYVETCHKLSKMILEDIIKKNSK